MSACQKWWNERAWKNIGEPVTTDDVFAAFRAGQEYERERICRMNLVSQSGKVAEHLIRARKLSHCRYGQCQRFCIL